VMLTATAGCLAHKLKWLPVPLGLLLVSKQYLPAAILMLPVHAWRGGRTALKRMAFTLLVACVVTMPFLFWDFNGLIDSTLRLQMAQPYRPDSLSFLAWWGSNRPGWIGPWWLAFAAMLVAGIFARWRKLSFTATLTLCYFAFFAFNKQAFANYYYLVLGAMACECVINARRRESRDFLPVHEPRLGH